MRQTVSNAQGPDLMILSRNDGTVVLHLFQCKNLKKSPTMRSDQFIEAFWSLGVKINKEEQDIHCEPDHGSAGYSYHGIQHLARKLGEKLGSHVTIGNRTLVLPQKWKQDRDPQNGDFLHLASKNMVRVWNHEMLEPTISALYDKNAQREKEMGEK